MKSIKSIFYLLFALPILFTACEPKDPIEPLKVTLEADMITAEIGQTVTFTVKYDGKDVTDEAEIKDETNGITITGNTVKVNTPGEVKFVALYKAEKSNLVTVTVTGTPKITLSVDNELIYAGGEDKAVFTLKSGDDIVTDEAVITNITTGQAMAKGVAEFSSMSEGVFKFTAEYDEITSATITVYVTSMPANPLTISALKPRIQANGSDFTEFKVMYMHKDVTSTAKIKNLTENKVLSENRFSYSGALKSVSFEAEYDGKTSNTVSVGFGDFYKNVMMLRFTGTGCVPCGTLGMTLKTLETEYPDRIEQVAVHCNIPSPDLLTPEQFSAINQEFKVTAAPTVFLDFDKTSPITNGSISANQLLEKIKEYQRKSAMVGIAANSVISGNDAVVTVNVNAASAGSYYLGVMLVEDGITGYPQANAPADYIHDNVFRYMATNITGAKLGSMTEGQELSQIFTLDLKDYKKENCRIVCYVVAKDKFAVTSITNIISCPINGFKDYRFEE